MRNSDDMKNVLYRGVGYAVVDIDGKMKAFWAEGIWTEISLYKAGTSLSKRSPFNLLFIMNQRIDDHRLLRVSLT